MQNLNERKRFDLISILIQSHESRNALARALLSFFLVLPFIGIALSCIEYIHPLSIYSFFLSERILSH